MINTEAFCVEVNVSRLSRSLGLVNEIFHLTNKLQRNRNFQPSKIPKFWLAAVRGCALTLMCQYLRNRIK